VHDTPIPPGTGDDEDAGDPDTGADSHDSSTGLFGNFECGVGPVYGQDSGAAYVDDAGVVTFEPIAPNNSEVYSVAVQDSADVAETITGATLTGPGASAFLVQSWFPIPVPAGQQALVTVRFTPRAPGTFSADLVLQTANMGPSTVALAGSAQ
jgi:hypothetical protein